VDTHESVFEGHMSATLNDAALDHNNTSHDSEQIDHCDHFVSHFTTLLATATPGLSPELDQIDVAYDTLIVATDFTPPYRPPIL
jgi:hypothetical protein